MTWPLDHTHAFGAYVLTLGLVIAGLSLFSIRRGWSSRWWPTVVARVTAAKLDEDTDGQFSVDVTFVYSVGDDTYTRTENITVWLPSRENAERVLRRHPVGGVVEARYKPSRPRVAVLRVGVTVGSCIWLAAGAGVTTLGIGMLAGAM